MYENYKIVCNTAAGRRRYMQYLLPPVLECDIVDRYDIWVNTLDRCDIAFFEMLADRFPKVNLVWQPDGKVAGNRTINVFYRDCCDDGTIYVKLDDDIVWLEPGFFGALLSFRVAHPEYFLVSPLVINNAKGTYFLQTADKLAFQEYQSADIFSHLFWRDGDFAREIHEWFLSNYLEPGKTAALHLGVKPIAATRFSINCVSWFGREMAKFAGVVPGDDEEWLSCTKPSSLGMPNCFFCDTIAAHFAFYPQRESLDCAGILERYGSYLHKAWQKNARLRSIDEAVQNCMRYVEEHAREINQRPCRLTAIPLSWKQKLEKFLKKTRLSASVFELYAFFWRLIQARRNRKRGWIVNAAH